MAKTPRKARTAAPDAAAPAAAPDTPAAAPVAPGGPETGLSGDDNRLTPAPTEEIALLAAQAEIVDLDDLYPYERNSRTHSPEQKRALAAAMRKYGWTMPLLIREDGGLIAGHARWEAATEILRLKRGPAIVARGWTEEMIRAYVIWDNRSAELAGWDLPVLRLELGALDEVGFDLTLTGFTLGELEGMEAAAGIATPGGAPGDPIGDPPAGAYQEQFGVVVVCQGEADQKSIYERLHAEGLNCRVVKV